MQGNGRARCEDPMRHQARPRRIARRSDRTYRRSRRAPRAPGRTPLASLLQDMGHEVRGARDGDEALDLAASWQPDFVLLDIHMPKLNGFKVARELRTRLPAARMHLVMMSGNTLDDATLAGAKAAGFARC